MKGSVDRFGRAVVEVLLRPTTQAEAVPLLAWVDTAFNGELVISQTTIDDLGLPQSAGVEATLAAIKQL